MNIFLYWGQMELWKIGISKIYPVYNTFVHYNHHLEYPLTLNSEMWSKTLEKETKKETKLHIITISPTCEKSNHI